MPLDDNRRDRRHLQGHLGLAQLRGGENVALGGGNRTQSRDGEFAPHDDHNDPGGSVSALDQGNERRGSEQFVRDRIEQNAKLGDLASPPRQMPVQKVRRRRRQKHPHRPPIHVVALGQQQNHDERHKEDSEQSQREGEIHGPSVPLLKWPCR